MSGGLDRCAVVWALADAAGAAAAVLKAETANSASSSADMAETGSGGSRGGSSNSPDGSHLAGGGYTLTPQMQLPLHNGLAHCSGIQVLAGSPEVVEGDLHGGFGLMLMALSPLLTFPSPAPSACFFSFPVLRLTALAHVPSLFSARSEEHTAAEPSSTDSLPAQMEQTPQQQQQQQQQDAATDSSFAARVAELTVQEEPEAAREDEEDEEEEEEDPPVTISVRFTAWSNDARSRHRVLTYLRTWADLETDAPEPRKEQMAARLEQTEAEGARDDVIDEPVQVHFRRISNVTRCESRMNRDHELIWTGPVAQFTLAGDPRTVALREAYRAGRSPIRIGVERGFWQAPWRETQFITWG